MLKKNGNDSVIPCWIMLYHPEGSVATCCNVSAFRLVQYRKSKTKVLIFANQSAGEYHQEPMRTQGQQNTIDQLASDFGLNLID